jgi:hypothetical protein
MLDCTIKGKTMSVDLWAWRTFVSSAVGAAVVLVPIYLFGFKQLIDSKDAAIETLREQIKSLERLPPSAAVIAFDLFFRARFDKINELLNRVSSGGELVTLEELKIDPNVTRKIAQTAEAAKRSSVTDAGSNREPVH